MDSLLLDIKQVAKALHIGRRTAYVMRTRPDFPRPITLASRVVRYRASDVREFVERLKATSGLPQEPEQLRLGKTRRRGVPDRASGETWPPPVAKTRPVRRTAEQSGGEQ